MESLNKYKNKYLKYKNKYLKLKQINGGTNNLSIIDNATDWDCDAFEVPILNIPQKLDIIPQKLDNWHNLSDDTKDDTKDDIKDDTFNGITIDTHIIKKISGPTIIYFFEPKMEKRVFLPMILLFGDEHNSKNNNCVNCNCDDKNNCCYEIDSSSFLSLLNNSVNLEKKKYIDFYIETSGKTTEGFADGYLNTFVTEPYINCYNKLLKEKCPMQNIRWHFVDIRFINTRKKYIDNDMYYCLELIRKWIVDYNPNDMNYYENNYDDNIKKINMKFNQTYFNNLDGFIKKLELLLILDNDKQLDFEKFSNEVSKIILRQKKCLISKQYNKLEFTLNLNKIYLDSIDFYSRYLNFTISEDKYNPVVNIIKLIKDKEYGITIQKMEYYKTIEKNIQYFIMIITAPLFDIYTVFRMLKKPKDGTKSTLALGYFGQAHVKNIANIFKNHINTYEDPYIFNNNTRCVEINKPINLTKKINEYPDMI